MHSPSQVGAGRGAEEEEEEVQRQLGSVGEGHRLELAVLAVELFDFAAVAHRHPVAVELSDQVARHRLAEVRPPVQERDQGAAAGEPDRRLRGRVAAADDPDALGAAEPRLGRAGGVEDADPLVVGQSLDRQAAVFGAGREQHRPRRDFVALLEVDDLAVAVGLEPFRPVGRRRPRPELARLRDRAAGQLVAADPGREPEVVLDPPRGSRLAAEHRPLDHQRLEALRGPVDRGPETARAAAEDQQVDLLALAELEPDPERPRELAGLGARSSPPPGTRTSGIAAASRPSRAAPSAVQV